MFLLNPGRYFVADPELALKAATLKKLLEAEAHSSGHCLKTSAGRILTLSTGAAGVFATDIGKVITTTSGEIAFIPCSAAEKLLPSTVIRLALNKPTLLYFNTDANIVLDGKLTIYC